MCSPRGPQASCLGLPVYFRYSAAIRKAVSRCIQRTSYLECLANPIRPTGCRSGAVKSRSIDCQPSLTRFGSIRRISNSHVVPRCSTRITSPSRYACPSSNATRRFGPTMVPVNCTSTASNICLGVATRSSSTSSLSITGSTASLTIRNGSRTWASSKGDVQGESCIHCCSSCQVGCPSEATPLFAATGSKPSSVRSASSISDREAAAGNSSPAPTQPATRGAQEYSANPSKPTSTAAFAGLFRASRLIRRTILTSSFRTTTAGC